MFFSGNLYNIMSNLFSSFINGFLCHLRHERC